MQAVKNLLLVETCLARELHHWAWENRDDTAISGLTARLDKPTQPVRQRLVECRFILRGPRDNRLIPRLDRVDFALCVGAPEGEKVSPDTEGVVARHAFVLIENKYSRKHARRHKKPHVVGLLVWHRVERLAHFREEVSEAVDSPRHHNTIN